MKGYIILRENSWFTNKSNHFRWYFGVSSFETFPYSDDEMHMNGYSEFLTFNDI